MTECTTHISARADLLQHADCWAFSDTFLNHTLYGDEALLRGHPVVQVGHKSKPPTSKPAIKHGWKHYGLGIITVMCDKIAVKRREGNVKREKKKARKIKTDGS